MMTIINKYWHIITFLLTALVSVTYYTITWASDINHKQAQLEAKVLTITEVQSKVNDLAISNVRLQTEVENIKQMQERIENNSNETNRLLRQMINDRATR